MDFFKRTTKIDFLGKRVFFVALTVVLITISILSLATRWLNLGLDFTGGTLIEVGYPKSVELQPVRAALEQAGFPDVLVQHFGSSHEVLIQLPVQGEETSADLSNRVLNVLRAAEAGVEMRRIEFVGPQVGRELTEQGGLAMLYALIGILLYVWMRFEYRFAIAAIVATAHDTIFTLGMFSLLQYKFDLTVLAALLAVIGYSLNDTIVVFDRIRENFRTIRKGSPVEIMNTAINATLSRTLMTSGTTMIVVVSLFYFGGEVIHGFSLALIIGILIGTFSSIYVASPVALWLGVSRKDLMPVKKDATGSGAQV